MRNTDHAEICNTPYALLITQHPLMPNHESPTGGGGPRHPFQQGQTVIFLGDHTSPEHSGYVKVISGVLSRFHQALNLNLISAGSKGQTAAALRSRALLDILTSSRP